MLIALFTILFLGGTPTGLIDYLSDVQDEVKVVMPKNDQRKAALNVLKNMEKTTKAQNKQVANYSKQLSKALADHDFEHDEIDSLWAEYHETRGNFQMEMIDLRFELKNHVAREEWQDVFGDG
jgi:hypothetical protein